MPVEKLWNLLVILAVLKRTAGFSDSEGEFLHDRLLCVQSEDICEVALSKHLPHTFFLEILLKRDIPVYNLSVFHSNEYDLRRLIFASTIDPFLFSSNTNAEDTHVEDLRLLHADNSNWVKVKIQIDREHRRVTICVGKWAAGLTCMSLSYMLDEEQFQGFILKVDKGKKDEALFRVANTAEEWNAFLIDDSCDRSCAEACTGPHVTECRSLSQIFETTTQSKFLVQSTVEGRTIEGWYSRKLLSRSQEYISFLARNCLNESECDRIYLVADTAGDLHLCKQEKWVTSCDPPQQRIDSEWTRVQISFCDRQRYQLCVNSNDGVRCESLLGNKYGIISMSSRLKTDFIELTSSPACLASEQESSLKEHSIVSDSSIVFHEARHLAITHYSGFIYRKTMGVYATHYYTFVNTHTATVSITFTVTRPDGATWGPTMTMYKPWTAGAADWTIAVNPRILTLTPSEAKIKAKGGTMIGSYTIVLKENDGFPYTYDIKVLIACSATSGSCLCPTGMFPSPSTSSCATCGGVSTCNNMRYLGCIPVTFSTTDPTAFSCNTCLNAGQFLDQATGLCGSCNAICSVCTGISSSQCVSCASVGATLAAPPGPSACVCSPGFYPNPTVGNCSSCSSACATCSSSGATRCTSCKSNAMLLSSPTGSCQCNAGYAGTPDNCQPCHSSCLTCNGTASTSCTACIGVASLSGAAPNSCKCPNGYYGNPDARLCSLCHSECATCVGALNSQCSSCVPSIANLIGAKPNSCICSNGYYGTPPNCLPCHPTCATCSNSASSQCTLCKSNASLASKVPPGSCYCTPSYYPNSTSANCLACHPTCAQCSGGLSSQCTQCMTNAGLVNAMSPGSCACLAGFLQNPTAANCVGCDASCKSCSLPGPNGCTSCYSFASLSRSSPSPCVCDAGYYSSGATCLVCDPTCQTCSGPGPKDCLSCISPAFLPNGAGSGPDICGCPGPFNPNCLICDLSCKATVSYAPVILYCVGIGRSYCTECETGAHLLLPLGSNSESICVCDSQFFPQPTPANCKPCHSSCGECSGPSNSDCIQCKTASILLNGISPGTCVCASGYYPDIIGDCQVCSIPCKECVTIGTDQCSDCFQYASVIAGNCVCDAGFFPAADERNCKTCYHTCKACSGATETDCKSCFANATLGAASPSACVCASGRFPNPYSDSCSICDSTCKECNGASTSDCTACFANAVLENGLNPAKCVCTDHAFTLVTSAFCQLCDPVCLQCTQSGSSSCSQCYPNASLISTAPSACQCVPLYFPTPTVANCMPCDSTCASCSMGGSNGCVGCYGNAGLSISPGPSSCVCLGAFYPAPDSSHCQPCDQSCRTCDGPNISNCLDCYPNAYLNASPGPSICRCNPSYFPDPNYDHCTPCDSSCKNCIAAGASQCAECFASAFLDNSGGLGVCTPCDGTCNGCVGAGQDQCTACWPFAHLLATSPSTCFCDISFYPNPSVSSCTQCSPACQSCVGPGTDKCDSCPSGFVLAGPSPNSCTCSAGYFLNLGVCVQCHSSCFSCTSGTKDACTKCKVNSKLTSSPPSACACVSGYFLSPDESSCLQCSPLCATCRDASSCSTCKANSSLVSSICRCNAGFNESVDQCVSCDPSCATCNSTGCITCKANSHLSGFLCVCEDGYVPDIAGCKISQCGLGCASCPSTGICEVCYQNAEIVASSGKCSCKSGFYANPDPAHCYPCHSECFTCSGGTNQDCISCKHSAKLLNSTQEQSSCVCLDGYFPIPDVAHCSHCITGCKTCINSETCERCRFGFALTALKMCKSCDNCDSLLVASAAGPTNTDYILSFNRYVPKNFTNEDIFLQTDPESPISWSVFSNLTVRLSGGPWANIIAILIDFLTPVVDEFGFPLSNPRLSVPPPLDPIVLPVSDSPVNMSVTTAASVTIAVIGGSAGVVVVSAGGGSLAMALLSQMQYFSYIGTANYSMTGTMNNFYTNLNQKSTIPNVFKRSNSQVSAGRRLDSIEELIVVNDFLDSSGQYITLLAGIMAVHLSMFLLAFVLGRRVKILHKVSSAFRYSVYLHFWYFAYLDLQVSALLQLNNTGFSAATTRVLICEIVAVLVLASTAITPGILFWFIRSKADQLISSEETILKQRFSPLVSSLRTDVRWAKYLVPVYYFQRLIYSLFIVFMRGRPLIQSLFLIVPCGLMTLFTLITRPLIFKTTRILHIIAEIDTLIVFVLLCFATMQYNTPEIDICWVVVAFTLKSFICTVVIVLFELATAIRKACKRTVKDAAKMFTITTESIATDMKTFKTAVWADQTEISFGGANEKRGRIYPYLDNSKIQAISSDNDAGATRRSDQSLT